MKPGVCSTSLKSILLNLIRGRGEWWHRLPRPTIIDHRLASTEHENVFEVFFTWEHVLECFKKRYIYIFIYVYFGLTLRVEHV